MPRTKTKTKARAKTTAKRKPRAKARARQSKSLLNNATLQSFITKVGLSQARKKALLEKLPQMDLAERLALLKMLVKVHLLDREQANALDRIKKIWQK